MFQNLHRGQRDTRLFPYLIHYDTLYPLILPQFQEYSVSKSSLLFLPIIVRLCRRFCRLPCPRKINIRLFPPPHPHLCPLLTLCCLVEVHKRSCRNVLRVRILPSQDVCLHYLKPHLRSRRLCQGVIPLPASLLLREPPCKSQFRLLMEPP